MRENGSCERSYLSRIIWGELYENCHYRKIYFPVAADGGDHPPHPARTRETSTTGRDGPNHRPRYQEGRVNQPEPVRGKSEIENQPNQV
jgi:hypothetical protein